MKNSVQEYSIRQIMRRLLLLYAIIPLIILGLLFCILTGYITYRNTKSDVYNVISFVSSIYDQNETADLTLFDNTIKSITSFENSSIIISDSNRKLLYSSNSDFDHVLTQNITAKTIIKQNGQPYYVFPETDADHSTNYYYIMSFWDHNGPLFRHFAIYLSIVILYIAFSMLALRQSYRKLNLLFYPIMHSLDNYVPGEHREVIQLPQFRIRELTHIINMINTMTESVENHIENEYKLTLEQQKAEYRALQAEINPHFLYNTLNVFTALNRIGDRQSLDAAIISLSKLFRYTCSPSEDSNTTIGQEFKFIENYFYLQKLRFEERLNYRILQDPMTENIPIPKLIIQPVVENCIKHGLEPAEISMTIELSSSLVDSPNFGQLLVISIVNDGIPFIRKETPGTDGGVGLSNVETRLKAFNPDSFMVIEGGIDKKTEFHIVIPR